MSEPKDKNENENEQSNDNTERLAKMIDDVVVDYLQKFKPENGKNAVTGNLVYSAILGETGGKLKESDDQNEYREALDANSFNVFLSKNLEKSFTGDELVAAAVSSGVELPDSLKNDAVKELIENEANKSNADGAQKSSTDKDPKEKSNDATDKALEKDAREYVSKRLNSDPEYRAERFKHYGDKFGGKVTFEQVLSAEVQKMVRNIKEKGLDVFQNPQDAKNEAQMGPPSQMGATQAIGRGVMNVAGGFKKGIQALNEVRKEKAEYAEFKKPAQAILSKEVKNSIKNINSNVKSIDENLEKLSSNCDKKGFVISREAKAKLREEVFESLEQCKKELSVCEERVDNPDLPKSERLKIHEMSEKMGKLADSLKNHPEGYNEQDKEFKEKLAEQAESITKITKKIIEMVKSFFQGMGKKNDAGSTPEMSM